MKISQFLLGLLAVSFMLFSTACEKDDPVAPETPKNETIYDKVTTTNDCDDDGTNETYTLVTVTDLGEGTGTMTWTKDKTWILSGSVFVNEGQVLTIEPGTIIKGAAGQAEKASALIVARGGQILAEGTKAEPIIFTSAADEIARDASGSLNCSGGNLEPNFRGLWGGLIILGNAGLNASETELAIEGIPTTETRGLYGGDNDADNSGVVKYVSIRHGGSNIGANNEINGLTLGGVGNGTTIEYIEVIGNKDDGVEFFGGTVNTKHVVVSLCGDDSFDSDEGYRGMNQFWFIWQDEEGDNGFESDGGPSDCLLCEPLSTYVMYNATLIGNGSNRAIRVRENCAASHYNNIFAHYGKGYEIKDAETLAQYTAGKIHFENNIFWNVATVYESEAAGISTELDNVGNVSDMDPMLDDKYIPQVDLGTASTPTDSFLENVNYKGAFKPGAPRWMDGWTLTSSLK